MEIVGILLCAGCGSRMGFNKMTTPLCGRTPVERSAETLIQGGITKLVLTGGSQTMEYLETLSFPIPFQLVPGGETRQESVFHALESTGGDIAVIHDGARPMVTPGTVRECIESAIRFGSGIAAVKSADTVIWEKETGIEIVPRKDVWLMQTPQCFRYDQILDAYRRGTAGATDDCTLYAAAGYHPVFVRSSANNFKLTEPDDWKRAQSILTRYGTGFDTHILTEGRQLILGGVAIPFEKGLLGHSDADVCVHAVIDALLGAAGMGDIGKLFPDSDEAYRGADSCKLLEETVRRIRAAGLEPVHIDAEILAQRPKLAPFIDQMRKRIADSAGIPKEAVSVKATTTEGMNDEGRGLCISSYAVASVR